MLSGKTVLIGVTGGIAAYKTCDIVSRLKKLGADVWVVMTKDAQEFVSPLTFRTLSGNPVITNLFSPKITSLPVPHISLSQKADLVLIAPATANIIGKIAQGIGDDALSTILLSTKAKKIFSPAMNSRMWQNRAVEKNVSILKSQGICFIGPIVGRLACGDKGIGHIAKVSDILDAVINSLVKKQDLKGKKILVTAGGTREEIDPVRFIGNRSTGKMGYALAEAARKRGAEVKLISGLTHLFAPLDIDPIYVTSAEEMKDAVIEHFKYSDVLIMAAAVADYRPKKKSLKKVKKGTFSSIELEKTPDILSEVKKYKGKRIVVGFAAETENLEKNAKAKLIKKGLDLIVGNYVEDGFGKNTNRVILIDRLGKTKKFQQMPKLEAADLILDKISSC